MTDSTAMRRRRARVLVVADHPVLRGVLRTACDASPKLSFVAEASSAAEAIDHLETARPDAMVVDLAIAVDDGLALIRHVRGERRALRILVLVNRADDPTLFTVMRAGADGCLEKTAGVRELSEALQTVAAGGRLFTPDQERAAIAELGRLARHAREASLVAPAVTPRELEILRYVGQGLTMRQVASRLGVSPRTVEAHIAKIYRKLGVTNRVRAIGRATELGLIELTR